MSLKYSAQVICGFKIDKKEITALETRYNNLTGKPYKIEVKSVKFFIGDTEIKDFYEDEKFYGLDIISSGIIRSGDGYSCDLFLGKVVATAGEYFSLYDKFSIDIPIEVYLSEEKFGISPSFFLTFNWS
jgi:hypothetical protein